MASARRKPDPHPEHEQRTLERALEGGRIPPAVVLRGEERYFRDAGVALVVRAAAERGFEVCRHDAQDPEFELPRLIDDLSGGALFAKGRCVVVLNAAPLLVKSSRRRSETLVDVLVARLERGVEGAVVLTAESLRADHAVLKAVGEAGGLIVGCRRMWDTPPPWDPDPRRAELVQWLLGKARERGMELAPDEAVYVVAATGNDPSALESQLGQLERRGPDGIAELVRWDAGGSPYSVAEHLLLGDAARAVAALESYFSGGFRGRDGSRTVDRAGLVAMLAGAVVGKLRETAAGAEVLEARGDVSVAAKQAGVKGPGPLRSFEARVGRRSAAEWHGLLEDAAELERRSRSGATVDASDFALLALRWRCVS